MKYLIFFTGFMVLGCFEGKNEIAEIKDTEIDYAGLILGEDWEKQFPNEDSILRFNYDNSSNPNGGLVSIFIPMSQRKAYVFKTYRDQNLKDKTESIESFETQSPFTNQKETIHFTRKDTISIDRVKWQRFLAFLGKSSISEYSKYYKNDKELINTNPYFSFEIVNNTNKSQLIRQDEAMENDFQVMYFLLLDAIGIRDFRSEEGFILGKSPLKVFDHLISGAWVIDTTWANGDRFHQRQVYEWNSDQKNIIQVKTYSETAPQTDKNGIKATGIRGFNTSNNTLYFYEFENNGDLTKGICKIEDQNIYYEYDYGDYKMTDKWLYLDKNTYQYIIEGKKEEASQVFMDAFVKRLD